MRRDVQHRAVVAAPGHGRTDGESAPFWEDCSRALSAADELASCRDPTSLLRRATELARSGLGLERVGLFVREPGSDLVLRGSWGTGSRGQTTDERTLTHELTCRDGESLLAARKAARAGLYLPHVPRFSSERGRSVVIGTGWVVATPLVAGRTLVGVMYNDAALTRSRVNEGKQAAAAVFCSLLALLYASRRGTESWQRLPQTSAQSQVVSHVLSALGRDLMTTGEQLALELGVSPGHLARSFKREMGLSLVDYRNRLRIDRFFEAIERSGGSANLLTAALEAGFGSYAQFHRVHRRFVGATPRDVLARYHRTGPGPSARPAGQIEVEATCASHVDAAGVPEVRAGFR